MRSYLYKEKGSIIYLLFSSMLPQNYIKNSNGFLKILCLLTT